MARGWFGDETQLITYAKAGNATEGASRSVSALAPAQVQPYVLEIVTSKDGLH